MIETKRSSHVVNVCPSCPIFHSMPPLNHARLIARSAMRRALLRKRSSLPLPLLSIRERLALPAMDTAGTGNRIGLVNVNARLKLSFGEDYGLKIESSESMTSVTIRIPRT